MTNPSQGEVKPFLVAADPLSNGGVFQFEKGSLNSSHDPKGHLRDKGVSHLQISGDIQLTRASYSSYDSTKYSSGIISWGSGLDYTQSLGYSAVKSGGYTYTKNNTTRRQRFMFDEDYLIVRNDTYNGDVFRLLTPPTKLYAKGSSTCTIAFYKRVKIAQIYLLYKGPATTVDLSLSTADQTINAFMSTLRIAQYGTTPLSAVAQAVGTSRPGDAEALASGIASQISSFNGFSAIDSFNRADFGQLAVECAKQLNYIDSNVLGMVFDINDWMHPLELWENVTNVSGWIKAKKALNQFTSKRIRRGHVDPNVDLRHVFKPFSSLFLYKKYAVDTAISDLGRIRDGLYQFLTQTPYQRLHSRKVVQAAVPNALQSVYTAVFTVETDRYPNGIAGYIQQTIANMKHFGIYPEMANLYDMLPYSFVVDWFVGYGSLIKQCDTYLNMANYFPVRYCVMSEKFDTQFAAEVIVPDTPVTGVVHYVYYRRWNSSEVPLPNVTLEVESDGLQTHSVEAGALVLQRV